MIVIPQPKATKLVKFLDINLNYANNVRLIEKYDTKALEGDIKATGLRNPLVLVESNEKGRYEILQGFRRAKSIENIRIEAPDRFAEVNAIIYGKETSDAERTAIMLDHANVKNLGDFEMYLSVKKMLAAGYTEEEIGFAHGKSRGWAQDRRILARLPKAVEDEWRKKALGQDCIAITTKDIRALDQLQTATKGTADAPSAEYTEAWGKLTAGGTVKVKEPKPKTRKELLEMIARIRFSEAIKIALRWAAGDEVGILDYDKPVEAPKA